MTGELTAFIEVAPSELGESLAAMRLCAPQAQQEMQLSLSRLGQLTPLSVYRVGEQLQTSTRTFGHDSERAACSRLMPSKV